HRRRTGAGSERPEARGIAEGEDRAVRADEPVAPPIRCAGSADDDPGQPGAGGRAVVARASTVDHGAQPGHRRVAPAVLTRQQRDDVGPDRRGMASATVADPLPVPRLRTRAAAGKGEGGMVPAEAAGPGVEEVVAGRPEGNGPAD